MNRNLRQFLTLLLQSIVFWVIAFCMFIMIRYYALNQEEYMALQTEFEVPISQWLNFGVVLGFVVGLFYGIGEFIHEKILTKKLNLGLSILLKSIAYLVVLILATSILKFFVKNSMDIDLTNERGWWMTNKIFWLSVGYFWVLSIVFSMFKIATERFGRGVFIQILLGKYRKPKEVRRIFMFLDLKSSTSIAEDLGHYNYSMLLQDCFFDLNVVIEKYDAQIYQYVGDEAVISWTYRAGIKNSNCIKLYFDFRNRLISRKDYYEKKYGILPMFKVGLHGGKLMQTEVGVGSVKKDLAYHGDVINTAARIQGECNTYNEHVLVSESLLQDLKAMESLTTRYLGQVNLKGKESKVNIYAVQNL